VPTAPALTPGASARSIDPYVILGACNPELAPRALEAEPDLGLLLPCNAVVYETEGDSMVEATGPEPVLALVGNPALRPIAREARARLERVVERVAGRGQGAAGARSAPRGRLPRGRVS